MERTTGECLSGLEVKLTAIPDSTTIDRQEDEYSCELVVRPPTVCFLACGISSYYEAHKLRAHLRDMLTGVPQINHWEEADEVAPHYDSIRKAIAQIISDMADGQQPLILQPIWKTDRTGKLAVDCLDAFVWSNSALLALVAQGDNNDGGGISRLKRTVIWVYRMLFDYVTFSKFDYVRIVKLHSYGLANDKAFALSGTKTYPYLRGRVLTHPRVGKHEIRNIILGGGERLLSPERRFDAAIVNCPELFAE